MKAIDVHCHVSTEPQLISTKPYYEVMEKYQRLKFAVRSEEEMVNEIRESGVKALIIGKDAEAESGLPPISNDYIAGLVKKYPDTFIGGWVCVDPWKGKKALQEAKRGITELKLIGLKFQPVLQGFFPNDHRFYPLYELCVELKVPVQFHTGVTLLGAGAPGGLGLKLKYTQPIPYLDDVAADFPDLTIIGCHPSWPWQDEMIAVAIHKGNVFMELSGWLPKYFPPELKRDIGRRLQDKVMFGSDYPTFSHKRLIEEWEKEGYSSEILEKVFYKNAQRILKLSVEK